MRNRITLKLPFILFAFFSIMGYSQNPYGKSINADFSVSPSGAMTYQIPFETPSYVLGHFPGLGLAFSSQAGDGIAGWGWSISGLSSISRAPATMHHDGFIDPVDFDASDRFTLDGQRLILKTGTYGAAGSVYETESHSNIKIVAESTSKYGAKYGPKNFIVYHPNGLRFWYGGYLDSTTSHSKLEWSLHRITDSQNNTVTFSYTNSNGSLRLDSVNDPVGKVKVSFEYGTKEHVNPIGIGGQFFTNNRLLTDIKVKVNNTTTYYHYDLKHEKTSYGVDRIASIKQKNRSGLALPELKFNYFAATGNDVEALPQRNLLYQVGDNTAASLISGDFNGDENIDFIRFSNDRNGDKFSDLTYSEGTKAGSFSQNIIRADNFEQLFVSNYLTSEGKFSDSQGIIFLKEIPGANKVVFDINKIVFGSTYSLKSLYTIDWSVPSKFNEGESLTNTISIEAPIGPSTEQKFYAGRSINANNTVSTGNKSVGYYANNTILLKDGFRAVSGTTFSAQIDPNQQSGKAHSMNYVSGDFNGDGITDILAVNFQAIKIERTDCRGQNASDIKNNQDIDNCHEPTEIYSESKAYFIDLNPNVTSNNSSAIGTLRVPHTKNAHRRFITGDYNGDGKTDLFHISYGKVDIYSLNKNNQLLRTNTISNTNFNKDNAILSGDYNGDGKTDLLVSLGDGSSTWGFYISNGNGFKYHPKNMGIDYRKNKIIDYFEYPPINPNSNSIWRAKSLAEYFYIPVDYNKDGKTDLIKHTVVHPIVKGSDQRYSSQWIDYGTNNSTSNAFLSFSKKRVSEKHNVGRPGKGHPIFADFSKRNLMGEYAYAHFNGKIDIYKYNGFHRAEVCIESTENNGLTQSFEYDGMTPGEIGVRFSDFHTYSDSFSKSFTYPYIEIKRANDFKLLKKVTETFSGHTRSKEYKYAGLVSSANGLGMLGFNYMASSSWSATNVRRFWTVSQYNPKLRGAVEKSWTMNTSIYDARNYPSSNFISKSSNAYTYSLKANKSYSITPKTTVNENGLTGIKSTTSYTYDSYNNVSAVKSSYPGGSKTVNATFYNNPSGTGSSYYVGRPKSKKTTTALGSETFSTEEAYTYTNNFIKTLKTKGNNTDWLTETYEHDTYGNITKKTISGAGIANRVEASKYYTGGRLMEWSTDIEGLKTIYKYDTNYLGHLKEEINPFGKSQKFEYDSWNRLTKTTDYLANTITSTYTGLTGGGLKITESSSLGGGSETFTNRLGWQTTQKTRNVLNKWVSVKKEYDATGKTYRESQPYFGASPSQWTTQFYDEYNRPESQTLHNGLTVTTTYNGLTVSVNDQTKTISTTKDAVGNTVSLTDPGGTINYTHYANNTPKATNYAGHIITTKIDGWGRKTELNDPAAGKYTYTYDILGQIKTETTPKGTTSYDYDNYGKILKKTIVGDLTDLELEYNYEGTSKLVDYIKGSDKIKNKTFLYEYTYDEASNYRISGIKETTTEASYERLMRYDPKGRIDQETYKSKSLLSNQESTVRVKSHFHPMSGGVYKYTDGTSNALLWEIKKLNQRGQLTETKSGNNILNKAEYDAYGLPTNFKDQEDKINGRTAMNIDFDFDEKRGNLKSRHNKAFTGKETFSYDSLDRLTTISGAITHSKTYDTRGRINVNAAVGKYNYDASTTYRVKDIDLNPAGTSYYDTHAVQQITYNAFKKPVTVYEKDHGRVDFEYGPMMNRSVAYYGGLDANKTKREYTKSYSSIIPAEIIYNNNDKSTKILTYIGGDAYTAGIVHVKKNGANAINAYHYLHRDHLGSILAITNASGTVIEQTHFGAWGIVEQFKKNGQNATFDYDTLLGRGYTGHEHFTSVGLIHMNGRMYDANLGRFLSPDNFIQDPYNTQSFNRYGYVWNNPLKFNDPSGEFFVIAMIIGAVIGAYIGGAQANGGNWNPFKWDWSSGATWAGIGIGAVVGAIGGEIFAAGIAGAPAFGIFTTVKLGVGIAIPGLGTFGIVKAGEKLQSEYTNPQGETFNQDIATIPTFGSSNNNGSDNRGSGSTDDSVVDKDDVIPAHLRGGTISAYIPTAADRWAEGNFVQRALYDTANAFSIVGQSMNPFDNQVTTLRGEDITSHDRGGYGAEVAATLLPIGGAKGIYSLRFTEMSFPALQKSVKSFSAPMNAFFKSGGVDIPRRSALEAYRELTIRIIYQSRGAPVSKASATAIKVQTQRLQIINKALGL